MRLKTIAKFKFLVASMTLFLLLCWSMDALQPSCSTGNAKQATECAVLDGIRFHIDALTVALK